MKLVLVVGEDALCCALGKSIVCATLKDWKLALEPISSSGITKLLPNLGRYAEQARRVQPVVCVADTDGRCAAQLVSRWRPKNAPASFVLRLAVKEAESWVLADREALARFFAVAENVIPHRPDESSDPKRVVLALARRSKYRMIREEVVSRLDPARRGTGYNLHLANFVRDHWSAARASAHSPSLARAVRSVARLGRTS